MPRSIIQSSNKKPINDFRERISIQVFYLSILFVKRRRRPFEYEDDEDTGCGTRSSRL